MSSLFSTVASVLSLLSGVLSFSGEDVGLVKSSCKISVTLVLSCVGVGGVKSSGVSCSVLSCVEMSVLSCVSCSIITILQELSEVEDSVSEAEGLSAASVDTSGKATTSGTGLLFLSLVSILWPVHCR